MIDLNVYVLMFIITIVVYGIGFVMDKAKASAHLLRIGGSIAMLYLGFIMMNSEIAIKTGDTIIQNGTTTTVTQITTAFGNIPIALTAIVLATITILLSSVQLWGRKFEDKEELGDGI